MVQLTMQEPETDPEAESEDMPRLPYAEAQAVKLVWRLAQVLGSGKLDRVAWIYVHRVLAVLVERVEETLADTADEGPEVKVPLTGSLPLLADLPEASVTMPISKAIVPLP